MSLWVLLDEVETPFLLAITPLLFFFLLQIQRRTSICLPFIFKWFHQRSPWLGNLSSKPPCHPDSSGLKQRVSRLCTSLANDSARWHLQGTESSTLLVAAGRPLRFSIQPLPRGFHQHKQPRTRSPGSKKWTSHVSCAGASRGLGLMGESKRVSHPCISSRACIRTVNTDRERLGPPLAVCPWASRSIFLGFYFFICTWSPGLQPPNAYRTPILCQAWGHCDEWDKTVPTGNPRELRV